MLVRSSERVAGGWLILLGCVHAEDVPERRARAAQLSLIKHLPDEGAERTEAQLITTVETCKPRPTEMNIPRTTGEGMWTEGGDEHGLNVYVCVF